MKPLHWNRVVIDAHEPNHKKSIWDGITDVAFNEDEFAELFAQKVVTRAAPDETKTERRMPQFTRLLDDKRFNAISIMRSRLPDDAALVKALTEMDTKVLSPEMIQSILLNEPTKDEITMVQEAIMNGAEVDKSEHFIVLVGDIPFLSERLKLWNFKNFFTERIGDIVTPLTVFSKAISELKASEGVKEFLATALTLGN